MRSCTICLLFAAASSLSWSQLTVDQKTLEFQQAAGLFAKQYAPADWKKKAFGIDVLDTAPWIAKIRATRNDLEFYEVMGQYFNNLNDAHVSYENPSNFIARLNFTVDIYDGKLLVDSVNRLRLPAAEYPFVAGYELVSIDGEDGMKLLDRLVKYSSAANTISTRRDAAALIPVRPQWVITDAPGVPEISVVVLRRFDGKLETYRLPWTRSGVPITGPGKFRSAAAPGAGRRAFSEDEPIPPEMAPEPDYMIPLRQLQNCQLPTPRAVLNFGSSLPVFSRALPPSFVQRLGRNFTDFFFSGVFDAGGYRIGFIRIPSYSPPDFNAAINQFATEIAFMQDRTDGLIVDEMRNPGGSVSFANTLLSLLHFYPWSSIGFEVRSTPQWVASISSAYESAKAQGAPKQILDQLLVIKNALLEANQSRRALSTPIPLDDITIQREPARDDRGNLLAYTKPVMVLIDEFSASGGDYFAATMQDNGRAPLFGHRTMGAGGNVVGANAGALSEGFVTVTQSLMSRKYERAEAGGYPVSPYVENVGVHPEIEAEYMTRENLITGGKPFVDAFVAAMVEHIRKTR